MNKAWTVLPPRYAKICSWHALLVSDHHDQDLNWPTTKNLFMTCTPSLWSSRSRLGLTYYESPGAEQEILSLGPKASPRSGAGMEQCWLGSARTAFCDLSCRTSVVACPVTVALKNKNKISHFQFFFFLASFFLLSGEIDGAAVWPDGEIILKKIGHFQQQKLAWW